MYTFPKFICLMCILQLLKLKWDQAMHISVACLVFHYLCLDLSYVSIPYFNACVYMFVWFSFDCKPFFLFIYFMHFFVLLFQKNATIKTLIDSYRFSVIQEKWPLVIVILGINLIISGFCRRNYYNFTRLCIRILYNLVITALLHC